MKILIVAPMPPGARAPGAIPLVLDAMLEGLRQHHEVTLVTLVEPADADWLALDHGYGPNVRLYPVMRSGTHGRARWARRWRFASTWLGKGEPWRAVWFWEPDVQVAIDELLAANRFDLVSLEDNASGLYRIPPGIPTVLTEYEVRRPRAIDWRGALHGPDRRLWPLRELDWQRWPDYQRRVWRRAQRLLVLTTKDAAAIETIAPDMADRARIVPFGVRLPHEPLDPAREEPGTLLFVGNFSHPPNVDAALWLGHSILPRLAATGRRVHLTVVGPDPPVAVRALAGPNVHVTGRVEAIEPYFERSAVILAPVRIGGGQRMKVLQAMAFGKAVVTTPRGAEGLALPGLSPPLALAETAEGMALVTAQLLDDAPARRALADRARAYAFQHFGPEAFGRRLEAVYQELLTGAAVRV